MMRAAGFRFPAEIVQTARAAVLRAVSLSPNATLDVRLIAAEKSHRIGALDDEEILRLYSSIPFSKAELSGPISTAEESWTPRTRALLIRAAASQPVVLAKAEVLRRAWQLGRERDGYAEISGTSIPVVAEIEPAAELLWFAKDAARVLFAAGRTDRALGWYAIAAADRERIEEARDAEAVLWPLAVLADSLPADREPGDGENRGEGALAFLLFRKMSSLSMPQGFANGLRPAVRRTHRRFPVRPRLSIPCWKRRAELFLPLCGNHCSTVLSPVKVKAA